MDKLSFLVLSRDVVLSTPIFTLFRSKRKLRYHDQASAEPPKIGEFYYLQSNDWVTIIPLIYNHNTKQYDVILVEQFRHGSESIVLEFPAGIMEYTEEQHRDGALRELAEETGYHTVLQCEQIGVSYPNPAIMSNKTFTYLALLDDKAQRQELQLDEMEALRNHRIPLNKLKSLIFAKDSTFNSALMLQALFWLENSKLFSSLQFPSQPDRTNKIV